MDGADSSEALDVARSQLAAELRDPASVGFDAETAAGGELARHRVSHWPGARGARRACLEPSPADQRRGRACGRRLGVLGG